jgi:hypothetical protein
VKKISKALRYSSAKMRRQEKPELQKLAGELKITRQMQTYLKQGHEGILRLG